MMAPTEILANQHYETIKELLFGMDIRVELLTGSIKGKKERSDSGRIADRRCADINRNTCRY